MVIRYHFPSSSSAWAFAQLMVASGSTVTDYGFDPYRSVNGFYVDVAEGRRVA